MKTLMNWMMISCRKAGELVEKKLNGEISAREQAELVVHKSFCNACRTYERQSKLIQRTIERSHKPPKVAAPDELTEDLKKKFK